MSMASVALWATRTFKVDAVIPSTPSALHDRQAAVDHQRRAGDERGLVAGEPEDRPGDLFGRGPAPEQRAVAAFGLQRLDALAGGRSPRDVEVGQRRAG